MGNGLKLLVAVTCIVVIGAAGFWTWKSLSDEAKAKEAAQLAADRRACERLLDDLSEATTPGRTFGEVLFCIENKHFTKDVLIARKLRYVYDSVVKHEDEFDVSYD